MPRHTSSTPPLVHIPTHVIMGFLGSGKTSAILDLFRQKPEGEVWAVLVNEMGDLGIDGKIYATRGITVEEIPGGCMCCAQGVPMRVAINRLLRRTRPHRLLVESSGVGHPSGLLKTLSGEEFREVLDIRAAITLVDPQKLLDPRLQQSPLFQDQLNTADILIANKMDRASDQAKNALDTLFERFKEHTVLRTRTTHGKLDINLLKLPHKPSQPQSFLPIEPAEKKTHSMLWQSHTFPLSNDAILDSHCITAFVSDHPELRIKGFVRTRAGSYLVNAEGGEPGYEEIPAADKLYLECIGDSLEPQSLGEQLTSCLLQGTLID